MNDIEQNTKYEKRTEYKNSINDGASRRQSGYCTVSLDMAIAAVDTYQELMHTIRVRFDYVRSLYETTQSEFLVAEAAALHGRKIIEAIAFGCLVATDNSLKAIPREAKGQWNAEKIFKLLHSKHNDVFPSPSIIRNAMEEEKSRENVKVVIEGQPQLRMTPTELVSVYQALHTWLHEFNPYRGHTRDSVMGANSTRLWDDLRRVEGLVSKHFISIRGHGFFCVLRDEIDGKSKVSSFSKGS
jgi:hypothetical protein